MFAVIAVVASKAFVQASSVNQPLNVLFSFVGFAGKVILPFSSTVIFATAEPPLELKVTVNCVTSTGGFGVTGCSSAHEAKPNAADAINKPAIIFLFFILFSPFFV